MRAFSGSFYCFLLKPLFNDYDVTVLKIIHPITFRIKRSTQSKCCKIRITSCKHATCFIKWFPAHFRF